MQNEQLLPLVLLGILGVAVVLISICTTFYYHYKNKSWRELQVKALEMGYVQKYEYHPKKVEEVVESPNWVWVKADTKSKN